MSAIFTTSRLTVRRFCPDDAADLAEILTDPAVTYFEPYPAFTPEACVQEAADLSKNEAFFAVVLKEKVIGKLYFAKEHHGSYELGYTFHGGYQGKGYAYESAAGLLEYAFTVMGVRRIFAQINARNEKSLHLVERLGLRKEAHHKALVPRKEDADVFDDFCVFALLKDEWNANAQKKQ